MGKYDSATQNLRKAAAKRNPCIANLDEIEPQSYERPGIAGVSWDIGEATGTRLLGVDVMMLGVQAGKGVEDTVEWPELARALVMDAEGGRKIIRRGGGV